MNMQMKKALVASALAVALASVGLASGCAAHTETYTGVQTPGIMTQPVEDTLKAAAEKAAAEKAEKALAAQREAAKKAAEEAAKAAEEAADEAALDGGEIVEDANAPEGTVAVRAADGTTRYVAADKAQASVDSGKTAPKKSESASNGGSSNGGSSNSGNSGSSGSSNKGNSGSSNSGSSSSSNSGSNGGSASKPTPAPEPKPTPAPEPEPAPEPDHEMNEGSTNMGHCFDCGWDGKAGGSNSCPACGSSNYGEYFI